MRQQSQSFIVEIKQSRKLKTGIQKPSIWGKLDLRPAEEPMDHVNAGVEPATTESRDRP